VKSSITTIAQRCLDYVHRIGRGTMHGAVADWAKAGSRIMAAKGNEGQGNMRQIRERSLELSESAGKSRATHLEF